MASTSASPPATLDRDWSVCDLFQAAVNVIEFNECGPGPRLRWREMSRRIVVVLRIAPLFSEGRTTSTVLFGPAKRIRN